MCILSLNIRSLDTSKSLLEDYVDNSNIDFVALSETHNTGDSLKFKNWTTTDLFKNRPDGTPYGGVALLPHPRLKVVARKDLAAEADPELELVWAQIGHKNQLINIICAYISPSSTLFDKFIDHVKTVLPKLPPNSPLIICG